MLAWICPKCHDPVLRYTGKSKTGPAKGAVIDSRDWETIQDGKAIPANERIPACPCGVQLKAQSRFLVTKNE